MFFAATRTAPRGGEDHAVRDHDTHGRPWPRPRRARCFSERFRSPGALTTYLPSSPVSSFVRHVKSPDPEKALAEVSVIKTISTLPSKNLTRQSGEHPPRVCPEPRIWVLKRSHLKKPRRAGRTQRGRRAHWESQEHVMAPPRSGLGRGRIVHQVSPHADGLG